MSVWTINSKPLSINGGRVTFPITYHKTYSGFTYETTGEYRETLDPAPGVRKSLTATYIQISGGNWSAVYTQNPIGLGDGLGIYAPSAGTYSLIWNNWEDYSNVELGSREDHGARRTMTKVLSLDFWGKTYITGMNDLFHYNGYDKQWNRVYYSEPITDIPQTSSNIHNGENLIDCSNLFNSVSSITSNLIPFITAMNAACPNLTSTNYCLSGAINAADYNEARALYPNWF